MKMEIKSGKEILDNFFNEIEQIPKIDQKLAYILKKLYLDNKFTEINISNALLNLRNEAEDGKD